MKDVMFDETLANELMLSKLWKEVEVKANDGDATTRDAFLRLLVADARKRWDAKKIVDKVENAERDNRRRCWSVRAPEEGFGVCF